MENSRFKLSYSIFLTLAMLVALPIFSQQQQNRQRPPSPTTEQIMQRLPEGVTFIPDIAYRKGNEAWKLDLAMPKERGDAPRPAIVFVHGGGWRYGDKPSCILFESYFELRRERLCLHHSELSHA